MGIYNRCQFFGSLLTNRLLGKRVPLVVVLNITNRCNLKCGYCYGQYFQSKKKDFTTKELLNLIDDLAKMGTRSITLGGGEPLLRNDIGTLVKAIKEKGIECGFNTNGSFIPQKIKQLKQADIVCISLDGPKKINDLNRGQGAFEKAMAGLEAALKAGLKTHISCVITRHNCQPGTIDWLVKLAKENKIQAEFNFLFQQAKGKKDSDKFMADNQSLRKAARRVCELKKQGAPILFSQKVYELAANWPDYKKRIYLNKIPDFDSIPCFAGRYLMFIDADGKVYPCVQLIGTFKALDFRQSGLKKAWDNCAVHPCRACYFPCFNEFNLITGLDWPVIFSQTIKSLKGD